MSFARSARWPKDFTHGGARDFVEITIGSVIARSISTRYGDPIFGPTEFPAQRRFDFKQHLTVLEGRCS